MAKTQEVKKLYKVAGYSYQEGYFVYCGEVWAKSELAAKRLSAKVFDRDFGYAEFHVTEIVDVEAFLGTKVGA
jgi:hypothetical protein